MALTSKILLERRLNDNQVQYVTQIYKEKEKITLTQLEEIIKRVKSTGEKKKTSFSIPLVRVLNGDKWSVVLSNNEYNNYYEGKVKNTSKFDSISQIQITTIFDE